MAIEFNKGAGVVEVVVATKEISNPAVKQYPISPVFVLFKLILRFYISLIGKMSIG